MQDQAGVTLLDIVTPHFTQHKDSPAVEFDDGETIYVSTYSQLQKSTEQVAAILKRMEVKDEIIGVCIPPSHNLPAVLLGVMGSGAAFYNFEPDCVKFVSHVVMEMGVRVVLMDPENLKKMEPMLLEYKAVSVSNTGLQEMGVVLIHLEGQSKCKHTGSLAYCITTSGTTGTPKIVRVPHQCIVPNITYLRELFYIKDSDLIFLSSPLTFDPSIVDLFLALGCGACLLIVPHVVKMMPRSLLSMLYYRHKVTYLQATPSLVSRIGSDVLKNTLLGRMSQLKILAFGGEKFPSVSLLEKWRAPDNTTKLYNLYGTTEVSCWSTCYEVTDKDFQNITVDVPLGKPLKDTRVTVMDDKCQEIFEGKGQLYLGGIKGRQCYLSGEETDKKLPVLRPTGDIVAITRNREIIFLHRLDDQIKRNGRRINLCEIEKVVLKLDAVADCRVLFHQNKLLVFVVLQCLEKIDSPKLHQWIQQNLPSQYWPDSVVIVTKFPVTPHGKLDKTALLQTMDDAVILTSAVSAEMVDVVVRNIWSEVLQTRSIHHTPTMNSNFITSGGDSLLAVQFSEKVEAAFNKRLSQLLDVILHDTYVNILCYIKECVCGQLKEIPQQNSETYGESNTRARLYTQSVRQKYEKECLNINDIDIHPFGVSSESKGKLLNRKRKYDDNKELIIHKTGDQSMKNLCSKASSLNREKNNQRIWSVGRGNSGFIRTYLKEDFETSHESTSKCNVQTDDCNMDSRLTDTFTRGVLIWDNVTLDICWKVNTGKCVDASPVIVRDRIGRHTVYIGSHSYKFYAITMETGEVRWETTLGDRVESSACVSTCGNYVIVGCYDGAIYVLKCLTGETWWKYMTGAEVKSSPIVDPQTSMVYVGSHDKHLYALDIKTRTCVFKTYLGGGSVFSSPTVSSSLHTVYVGALSGALSAVNSRNGDILWTYDCKKPLFSSPAVSPDGVYIGCVDGCLYHISTDGRLIWSFETQAPVFSSPVIHQQHHQNDWQNIDKSFNPVIIFGSHDHCVYVLSYDGQLLWKRKLNSPIYSVPFCFDLVIDEHLSDSKLRFGDQSDISWKGVQTSVKLNVDEARTLKSDIHVQDMSNCKAMSSSDAFVTSQKEDHKDWAVSDDDIYSGCHTTTLCHIDRDLNQSGMEESVNQRGDLTDSKGDENLSINQIVHQQQWEPEQFTSSFILTDQAHRHGNGDKSTNDNIHYSKSKSLHNVVPLCVVATTTGSIHVIDRYEGKDLGVVRLPGEVFSSPVVCGRNIVVGCRDNYIYCLNITPSTCN